MSVTLRKALHLSRLEVSHLGNKDVEQDGLRFGVLQFLTDKFQFGFQGFVGIVLLCICPSTLLKCGLLGSGFIWHKRIDIRWSHNHELAHSSMLAHTHKFSAFCLQEESTTSRCNLCN